MLYDYYWLSMIPVGFIILLVGFSLNRKSSLFMRNCVQTEAYVREIVRARRHHSGSHRNQRAVYIPYAEYAIDGRNIHGKHFEPVRSRFIKFREGDTITVMVNPMNPKFFCIDTVDVKHEHSMSVKMMILGIVVIILPLFAMLIRTQMR